MTEELEALEQIKLCFKRIEEVSKDAREVLGMELIGKIDWNNIEEISIIEKGLKANKLKINLIIDQSIHFIQVALTFCVCYLWLV